LSSASISEKVKSYTGSVASAATPITVCTQASCRAGSGAVSARRLTARPPSASPRMKVASISSNEWVDAPSTSDSMRIQLIS
jgi:hypothetical protein